MVVANEQELQLLFNAVRQRLLLIESAARLAEDFITACELTSDAYHAKHDVLMVEILIRLSQRAVITYPVKVSLRLS